jgi:hypothetical protein
MTHTGYSGTILTPWSPHGEWVVGFTLLNQRQSEEITRKLKVCSICETSEVCRIGWRDDMLRMPDNCSAIIL